MQNQYTDLLQFFWKKTIGDKVTDYVGYQILDVEETLWGSVLFTLVIDKTAEGSRLNRDYKKTLLSQLNKLENSDYIYSFTDYSETGKKYCRIQVDLPKSKGNLDFSEYDSRASIRQFVTESFNITNAEEGNWRIHENLFQYKQTDLIGDAHGDIIFNFKKEKRSQFYQLIKQDKASDAFKDSVKKLLDLCAHFHHSPENVCLLPSSGNLNDIKQSLGNDRIDVFVNALRLYYCGNESLILASANCTAAKSKLLKVFLDTFANDSDSAEQAIYAFYRTMYYMDDPEYVRLLCQLGSKPLLSTLDIYKYILLAIHYWKWRQSFNTGNSQLKAYYENLHGYNISMEFYVSGVLAESVALAQAETDFAIDDFLKKLNI